MTDAEVLQVLLNLDKKYWQSVQAKVEYFHSLSKTVLYKRIAFGHIQYIVHHADFGGDLHVLTGYPIRVFCNELDKLVVSMNTAEHNRLLLAWANHASLVTPLVD